MAENSEGKERVEKEPAAPPAKSRKKLFLIIGIATLVVILGGAGAFFFLGKGSAGDEKSKAEESIEKLKAEAEGEDAEKKPEKRKEEGKEAKEGKEGKEGEAAEEPESKSLVYKMDPIAANLNETNFKRMVSVTLAVEARDDSAREEVEKNNFRITDAVISLLSGKTQADLRSEAGKDLLKQEIKYRIDQLLGKGKVTFVGFQQFYFF